MQSVDGQIEEAYSISAGLDYPGIGPFHANLYASGRAEVLAVTDGEALSSAYELAQLEGIIPALESAHALGVLRRVKFASTDIVVLTLSGRGDKDMESYISHYGERELLSHNGKFVPSSLRSDDPPPKAQIR
jgi:tryptophan synthase beta chain